MSVTTSAANVEPPPLLFGQRSPSSSPFSSPAQSPNHIHHTHTPVASPSPLQPVEDVAMSTSSTLPPLAGQNHDRQEDALMHDSEGLPNGHVEMDAANTTTQESSTSNIAVEVAAVDEDAMDTTPDNSQSAGTHPVLTPTSPPPDGVVQVEPVNDSQSHVEPSTNSPQTESVPPIEPPPPNDHNSPSPAPPEPVRSDVDSSDEDETGQPWHPIQEDTSSPDEAELKEIEAGAEVSALDHEYWEKKAFTPLDEPEYTAGASGRIEWTIDNYNGTKEKPNKELLMKSEPVNIGGYEWQIKFYPRGNDSDYLSVYVECLSVQDPKANKEETPQNEDASKDETAAATDAAPSPAASSQPELREIQHTPLPPIDPQPMFKRKSVAAQVLVVLYNPAEPRVNYSRPCLHRFCTGSPDWGWTRFHGPYYDIAHRVRGQRQALLRDDKLKFTGYIRIVDDSTGCLWEHPSRDNPWDSFAMTGLQSLTLGDGPNAHSGGNMISVIASWMLFKPFRTFLYNFEVPDPEEQPFTRPKPLVAALQKVLYMLRTQVKPGAGSVTLDAVLDALEWYGIQERLHKLDVMEVWEILRLKVEEELRDTASALVLEELFGLKQDFSTGTPSYRAPVLGVESMQEAINKSADLLHDAQALPQLLAIELERQEFDVATRSYVKLLNKVKLDDNVTIRDTPYTLYGFVAHNQTLQSYVYHPILRPDGPDTKWFSYTDGKDSKATCLAQRQAVEVHEGRSGAVKVIANEPVAYVVMYVRGDIAESALTPQTEHEQWQVPDGIRKEVQQQEAANVRPPTPSPPEQEAPKPAEEGDKTVPDSAPAKTHDFQVIDSRAFLQHEGPGTFDAYDSKWLSGDSEFIYSVQLCGSDTCKDIRRKLSEVLKGVKEPRQIKFWFVDALGGSFARPNLLSTGFVEYSSGSSDHYADQTKEWVLDHAPYTWAAYRIWVHVVDLADLPEIPKKQPKVLESAQVPPAATSSSEENLPEATIPEVLVPPPEVPTLSEDTPMSETDEDASPAPEVQSPLVQTQHAQGTASAVATENIDTAMAEVDAAVESVPAAGPSADDVLTPDIPEPMPADTEMGGTQGDSSELPLPPADLRPEPVTPPPESAETTHETIQEVVEDQPPPDEIYFFLKVFNAETQKLEPCGSYIARKNARVDSTILGILGLPSDKKIEMYEEEDLVTTHPIKNRRSFAQTDLHNTAVIILAFPLSEELCNALADRAAFADIQQFLAFRTHARNFPTSLTGHFTFDRFSSQFYKGEIKNGHRHGHGRCVYHSGATYEGNFRLSQRHGHGLYTFQNGDTYDGDWAANQQHGSGTYIEAATGNTYVGGWKNDKKFGEGVTHWKNAQEAEHMCRICWEDNADAAFYDCGHVVACLSCARQVKTCPVCRKPVNVAMKLYYVS